MMRTCKMKKRKVSFDIEEDSYERVKELCEARDLKMGQFFRSATDLLYEREKKFMTVYLILDGKIEKKIIDTHQYVIEVYPASEEMKINVGAKREGVLQYGYEEKSKGKFFTKGSYEIGVFRFGERELKK